MFGTSRTEREAMMGGPGRVWLRRGAVAVAAGRVGIGVAAMVAPALIVRPWAGAAANGSAARVLARALAGRDLALGLGALAALRPGSPAAGPPAAGPAPAWVGAGALADTVDALTTVASWKDLPAGSRWLVAASACGAAVTGTAWSLAEARQEPERVSRRRAQT